MIPVLRAKSFLKHVPCNPHVRLPGLPPHNTPKQYYVLVTRG